MTMEPGGERVFSQSKGLARVLFVNKKNQKNFVNGSSKTGVSLPVTPRQPAPLQRRSRAVDHRPD